MSDQSKLGLGRIITTEQNRDAIHVAIAPVTASESIIPGKHVGLDAKGNASTRAKPHIGVIDPFLKEMVGNGERCWLFLYPGSITSLRHEWAHPAFSPEEKATCDKEASVKWVTAYAQRHCCYYKPEEAYERFMESVKEGDIYYYGNDLHSYGDLEDPHELFAHLAIILGRPVGRDDFNYTCSC